MKHPRTAALTGGIAGGKSTVSQIFRELGAYIIDADILARQVINPGQPAWQEIVDHFGHDILQKNGYIHRKKLGQIVFRDPKQRKILEQFIHPRVIAAADAQEQSLHAREPDRVIVVDVPLLIEASMHTEYVTILVVYVSEEIQMTRLMERDQISEEIARQRIRAQMPLSEKVKYATHIIDNNGTLEQTRKQVKRIYHQLCHK